MFMQYTVRILYPYMITQYNSIFYLLYVLYSFTYSILYIVKYVNYKLTNLNIYTFCIYSILYMQHSFNKYFIRLFLKF